MSQGPVKVQVTSIPLSNGYTTLECSMCGPLGLTLMSDSRVTLMRHLVKEHSVPLGAPA